MGIRFVNVDIKDYIQNGNRQNRAENMQSIDYTKFM
jgi:hypothetical protein